MEKTEITFHRLKIGVAVIYNQITKPVPSQREAGRTPFSLNYASQSWIIILQDITKPFGESRDESVQHILISVATLLV